MAQHTSAARPKRAGEDFAKQHDQTSKKPRFDYRNPSTLAADAPEEDLILDADVIGKGGNQTKRNAVNIDGYESDSDNDNFDARAAEREREGKTGGPGKGSRDEEEDDMFADLEEDMQGTRDGDEDEEVGAEGKRQRKDVRFLEQREIEGQVMGSTSGGHVSADLLMGGKKGKQRAADDGDDGDSGSSSGEEETRDELPDEMEAELATEIGAGGKKKHAPRLDAFNLRDEEDEGRFDASGNFVRKAADPEAANDSWLDGVSKRDVRRAREAQAKREALVREEGARADALLTGELLGTLVRWLEVGETPLEALVRLGKGRTGGKKVPGWKRRKLRERGGMDVDEVEEGQGGGDAAEAGRKEALDAITAAADALFSRAMLEVYETEREMLMRQYKRETGDEWTAPKPAQSAAGADGGEQWEYRWSDARDGGEHHGPYDAATMQAWDAAGYFGEGVEFRRVGGTWDRVLDVR